MWFEFPGGCFIHVRNYILNIQQWIQLNSLWCLSLILLHCCLDCTFLSLPGNNKWQQQLNVMNPISTNTCTPSLLKLYTLNVLIRNLCFSISDKKARPGRKASGGVWIVKHRMEYFCGANLWTVLAQSVGAVTCRWTNASVQIQILKAAERSTGGMSKQPYKQLLLV